MANENVGRPRTAPVRIIRMSIAPDPVDLADAPLVIVAEFDPGPGREEQRWWIEQLRAVVTVRAWTGRPPASRSEASPRVEVAAGLNSVSVEAPRDQVEVVARRLLRAVEEANAAYPERYEAWRREHDKRMAEERLRQQRRFAAQQAILDRVMDEYRSNQ